jgi:SAM-dependent methyltransferase
MRRFWDARARENALFFVDDRLAYDDPDEEEFWSGGEEALDFLLSLFEQRIEPTDTVVDIGCGVGRFARALAARAKHVLAIDISAEMLARAREANDGLENVDWIQGDGVSLRGVGDEAADVCFSHVVFHHIPDPAITLGYVEEIGRVLGPGGWALIQVSNDLDSHRATTSLRTRLRALARRGPRGSGHPAWLGSAVDLADVRAAAKRGGMELDGVWGKGALFCELLLRKPRA